MGNKYQMIIINLFLYLAQINIYIQCMIKCALQYFLEIISNQRLVLEEI